MHITLCCLVSCILNSLNLNSEYHEFGCVMDVGWLSVLHFDLLFPASDWPRCTHIIPIPEAKRKIPKLYSPVNCFSKSCSSWWVIRSREAGAQGWRSGESAHLPPMWPGYISWSRCQMWVEFVVGFSPGTLFSPLLKNQHNQIPIRLGGVPN